MKGDGQVRPIAVESQRLVVDVHVGLRLLHTHEHVGELEVAQPVIDVTTVMVLRSSAGVHEELVPLRSEHSAQLDGANERLAHSVARLPVVRIVQRAIEVEADNHLSRPRNMRNAKLIVERPQRGVTKTTRSPRRA